MKSKVIRFNQFQIMKLRELVSFDIEYYTKELETETDINAIDYMKFELEIANDIWNKIKPELPGGNYDL